MNPNKPIIDADRRIVLAVTGGGQTVIGELTRYGGMSKVLLEAVVPYSQAALTRFLGGEPSEKIVSTCTAREMAMAAYWRGVGFAGGDVGQGVRGVASTAALVKPEGEREGRAHRLCIAIQYPNTTIVYENSLAEFLPRVEQEEIAAKLIMSAFRLASNINQPASIETDKARTISSRIAIGKPELVDVVHGKIPYYLHRGGPDLGLIMPTSMNPFHDGHRKILEDAEGRTGKKAVLELCVRNADKPPLDYIEIDKRTVMIDKGFGLIVSNASLFVDKVAIYPDSAFVLGSDTMDRILDRNFYGSEGGFCKAMGKIRGSNVSFLVYPRKGHVCRAYWDCELANRITYMEDFVPVDMSSTQIRRERDREQDSLASAG